MIAIYYLIYLEKELINTKMENHKKGLPLYIGIFAADPKTAIKVVKDNCKQAILDTLKQTKS